MTPYQRGRAWYVDTPNGDTYSFMSEREAERFVARSRNMAPTSGGLSRYDTKPRSTQPDRGRRNRLLRNNKDRWIDE